MIVITLIIVIVVFAWLWYNNPYYIINWWNYKIRSECDDQDKDSMNGIPSYHDAWISPSKRATELHSLIYFNHNDILDEVMNMIKSRNSLDDHISSTNKSGNKDHKKNIPYDWLKSEDKWNPIWIRFMSEWTGVADNVPLLKNILSLFPEISNLHISIFYPGNTIVNNVSPSRAFHRYHYGLSVPSGDIGLKINGHDVKWEERKGFTWDDTLPHSAWNHTLQPRIIIFADIFRELSVINSLGSKIIYTMLQHMKPVNHIKCDLEHEGVVMN